MSTFKTLRVWAFAVTHPGLTVRHLRAIRGRATAHGLGFLQGISIFR